MVSCHHRKCCGCTLEAEVVAETIGVHGVTAFKLCGPHLTALFNEAQRKRLPLLGAYPLDGADDD